MIVVLVSRSEQTAGFAPSDVSFPPLYLHDSSHRDSVDCKPAAVPGRGRGIFRRGNNGRHRSPVLHAWRKIVSGSGYRRTFGLAAPSGCVCQHLCAFPRSEEHTSELQSLMRISYAVFCLKKKTHINKKCTSHQY